MTIFSLNGVRLNTHLEVKDSRYIYNTFCPIQFYDFPWFTSPYIEELYRGISQLRREYFDSFY